MARAAVLIACLALLMIVINRMAEYRAENDLIFRLCADQAQVMRDLRTLLLNPARAGTSEAGARRGRMIAAKLLFILPRHGREADGDYLSRVSEYLSGRCAGS